MTKALPEHLRKGLDGGGTPSGTRTPNPLIKSQLLCQLSLMARALKRHERYQQARATRNRGALIGRPARLRGVVAAEAETAPAAGPEPQTSTDATSVCPPLGRGVEPGAVGRPRPPRSLRKMWAAWASPGPASMSWGILASQARPAGRVGGQAARDRVVEVLVQRMSAARPPAAWPPGRARRARRRVQPEVGQRVHVRR